MKQVTVQRVCVFTGQVKVSTPPVSKKDENGTKFAKGLCACVCVFSR